MENQNESQNRQNENKKTFFNLGFRFYAVAFLVIFYYFFTKPVNRADSIETE